MHNDREETQDNKQYSLVEFLDVVAKDVSSNKEHEFL